VHFDAVGQLDVARLLLLDTAVHLVGLSKSVMRIDWAVAFSALAAEKTLTTPRKTAVTAKRSMTARVLDSCFGRERKD